MSIILHSPDGTEHEIGRAEPIEAYLYDEKTEVWICSVRDAILDNLRANLPDDGILLGDFHEKEIPMEEVADGISLGPLMQRTNDEIQYVTAA